MAPLIAGRRIAEIGCGTGAGAARLLALGAASVIAADDDATAVARARATHRSAGLSFVTGMDPRTLAGEGPFDVVIVPDARALLDGRGSLAPATLKRLLADDGWLVVMATSGDRRGASGGLGFYQLSEALEPLFPRVRMFGVTPFLAYGVAEFAEQPGGLRVDAGLIDPENEEPTHYVAMGGPDSALDLGYALVQVPPAAAPIEASARVRATIEPSDGGAANAREVADLRRQLAEAQGQAEGVLRVSRAHAEEIEELRARLRRDAEARADLDQETARLRRALAEADESVLDLTRKTTEGMASLAQRLTAGLRAGEAAPARDDTQAARLREELRARETELAERESALSDRDDRIAALEGEKQDLAWRLLEAEEQIRVAQAATRAVERRLAEIPPPVAAPPPPPPPTAELNDLRSRLGEREKALEHYRQAALAHGEEVNRQRDELAEQSTLVAELEESLDSARARATTATEELERVRRHTAEIEDADRVRRSRLAEVEGTLLRLQRQTAASAAASNDGVAERDRAVAAAQQKVAELEAQVATLEARLRQVIEQREDAARRWGAEVDSMVGEEPPTPSPANAADGPRLDAALEELSRLRDALERSEDQLWETKGQLLLDRERMAVLEHQLATLTPPEPAAPAPLAAPPSGGAISAAAYQAVFESVVRTLGDLESSLRLETARLESIERTLDAFGADPATAARDRNGPAHADR